MDSISLKITPKIFLRELVISIGITALGMAIAFGLIACYAIINGKLI